MVLTSDLIQRVSQCAQKIGVRGDDCRVEVKFDDGVCPPDCLHLRSKVSVAFFNRLSFGDHFPGDHRPDVFSIGIVNRAHQQVESFGAQLDLRPVREIFRIGKNLALVGRILVENRDARTHDFFDRNWQRVLQQRQLLPGSCVDLGNVQVEISQQNIDRHVLENQRQTGQLLGQPFGMARSV